MLCLCYRFVVYQTVFIVDYNLLYVVETGWIPSPEDNKYIMSNVLLHVINHVDYNLLYVVETGWIPSPEDNKYIMSNVLLHVINHMSPSLIASTMNWIKIQKD